MDPNPNPKQKLLSQGEVVAALQAYFGPDWQNVWTDKHKLADFLEKKFPAGSTTDDVVKEVPYPVLIKAMTLWGGTTKDVFEALGPASAPFLSVLSATKDAFKTNPAFFEDWPPHLKKHLDSLDDEIVIPVYSGLHITNADLAAAGSDYYHGAMAAQAEKFKKFQAKLAAEIAENFQTGIFKLAGNFAAQYRTPQQHVDEFDRRTAAGEKLDLLTFTYHR